MRNLCVLWPIDPFSVVINSVFVSSELRSRSFAETSQFQENFEVYIQALISQCLDANFLDEVFADQGSSPINLITKNGFANSNGQVANRCPRARLVV